MQKKVNLADVILDATLKAVQLSPTYPKKISFSFGTKPFVDNSGNVEVAFARVSCNGQTVPEYSDDIENCRSVGFELTVTGAAR
jgi:hypothetical protein